MTILEELQRKTGGARKGPAEARPTPYAQAGLGGLIGDDLLRLIHRRCVERAVGTPGAIGADTAAARRRVEEVLADIAHQGEAALPGAEAELEVLRQSPGPVVDFMLADVLALGPLAALLADPAVTEIMVNGPGAIFYERGEMVASPRAFLDDLQLRMVTARLLEACGRKLDPAVPLIDGRMPDGTQLQVAQPPASLEGLSLTIRKVPAVALDLTGLVARGTLSEGMATFLEACVRARVNLIVCGASGAGRSSLLNALAQAIAPDDRVIVIEDAPQLRIATPNRVHLRTLVSEEAGRELTLRDLVRAAVRMRPTRLVLGECQGGEVFDMLMAMTSGHEGCMATVHASSARDVVTRLQTFAQMAGVPVSDEAVLRLIGRAVELVVYVERHVDGVRRVVALTALESSADGALSYTDVFVWRAGAFSATGLVPPFHSRLLASGVALPADLYKT